MFNEVIFNNEKYYINTHVYNNLKGQYDITNSYIIKSNIFFNNLNNIEYNDTYSPTKLFMFVDNIDEFQKEINETIYKYYEPEIEVKTRTGEICTVALTPQYYIDYSTNNEYYKELVRQHINSENFKTDSQTLVNLNKALDWINEWPCIRYYGLGTKFLDTDYVIDSLSDSTIYMAYYTIAHLIENIPIQYLSDEFWDCIFLDNNDIPNTLIDFTEIIFEMRSEFTYWYPVDIRCSGKDLVNNHLIMCLLNHAFIWNDTSKFPKSYLINGHIKLNNEKMSKSTGNFMTLQDALVEYGASATYLTLAENDGIDDGNFDKKLAESNVNKLINEIKWMTEFIENESHIENKLYIEKSDYMTEFVEQYIENELNIIINKCYNYYQTINFHKIIHEGIHKLFSLRDEYRKFYQKNMIKYNPSINLQIIKTLVTVMRPICYHISQYIIDLMNKYQINYDVKNSWIIKETTYKYRYLFDIYNNVSNKINSSLQKHKTTDNNIVITIPLRYNEKEMQLIEIIKEFSSSGLTKVEFSKKMMDGKSTQEKKEMGPFIAYAIDKIVEYTDEWISFVNTEIEYNFLKEIIPYNFINTTINTIDYNTKKITHDDPQVIISSKH
jgi:leucyl-tRNA synthetase